MTDILRRDACCCPSVLPKPDQNVLQRNARYDPSISIAGACIAIRHKAEAVHQLHEINVFMCCDQMQQLRLPWQQTQCIYHVAGLLVDADFLWSPRKAASI